MGTYTDSGFPNIANWLAMQKPSGGVARVANVLSKKNTILEDIPWVEGNLPTGHRITQSANSLPSASWRSLNAGVAATKAETAQYDETCGLLEDESKIDVDLAALNGDAREYRARMDDLKTEGIRQQISTAMFYESIATNPERMHGLAPRYAGTSGYTASSYVLKGTNSGSDCRSIWLIAWDPMKIYGIYPKGSQLGLSVEDMGKQRVLDSNSLAFWAWVTNLKWKVGLAVEDYRYAVRFQWDDDDPEMANTEKGLYLKMQEMLNTIFETPASMRFYMDRTSKTLLDSQLAANDANLLTYISPQGHAGMQIPHFMGVPIRIDDGLVAETAIS